MEENLKLRPTQMREYIMKYCPECGSQLPNETIKFCPECGFKLSSQTKSDYNIVCPDCKTKIKDENSDCPNCGCPSSLFKEVQIPQKYTSELEQTNDQDVICPDCGLVMEKPIPAECPSCGCPSNRFKLHAEEVSIIEKNNTLIKKISIGIIILILGFLCFAYFPNLERTKSESVIASTEVDNTTETVYKGSRGTEVILCDNGIAYLDGTKGTWRKSSVTIGNRSHDYIQIDQNGYIQQGAICEGKFYYGRNAHFAVKEGWPDGEPMTKSRR